MTTVFLHSPKAIRQHLRGAIEPVDFDRDGARFVLCDDRNKVLVHCHLDSVPPDISPAECSRALCTFTCALAGGAMLLALTRPGWPDLRASDRHWFRAAYQACGAHEVRLLGVHVVTPRGQREVVLDDVL